MPYRPPPPKSKVGCVILGIVATLGFFGLIGGIAAVVLSATAPARDAGHAYLKKLRANDYQAAWKSSSSELQSHLDATELESKMEQSFPEAADSTDATFNSTSIQNSLACLGGSLETPSGSTPIYMRLLKEDGAWKVDAIAKRPVDGCH